MDNESFQARCLDFITHTFAIRATQNRYRVAVTFSTAAQRYYLGYERYNSGTQTYDHVEGSSDSANDSIAAFDKAEAMYVNHAARLAKLAARRPAPVPPPAASITTRPQVPFRLDRLVVPSDLAGLFTIDDVKVGKNSQFAAEGAVPARIFQENGVGVCLKGDTAQISMNVTIRVTNISGAASMFRAAVIGPAVE
jgi:hypothetical protein